MLFPVYIIIKGRGFIGKEVFYQPYYSVKYIKLTKIRSVDIIVLLKLWIWQRVFLSVGAGDILFSYIYFRQEMDVIMGKKKTAVEVYLSTVFKWGIIILVSACMCATVTFHAEKLLGLYPDVPWIALILFGLMDIIFFICAIFIVRTSCDEDGFLKAGRLKIGKLFSAGVLIIQWNCILYMIPSRTFWGFLFFFLILMAFFLDVKLVLVSGLICMISLFIGWAIRGIELLPVKDELFITDVLMCLIALMLSLTGLLIFVFFVAHFLVNAKKNELEENNEQVINVLG